MFRELKFFIFIDLILLSFIIFFMLYGFGDVLIPVSGINLHSKKLIVTSDIFIQSSLPQDNLKLPSIHMDISQEIVVPIDEEMVNVITDDTKQDLLTVFTHSTTTSSFLLLDEIVLFDVPFTPQAPFAEWNNNIFQYGCEEAVAIMAMRWVENKSLSPEEAKEEIMKMSDFEQKVFGEFRDISAKDTTQMMRDYFDYPNIEFVQDIDVNDIKRVLTEGALVIVPVNAMQLNNPFFTPPGPREHMIVILGYDAKTKEFITHDPGTKRGKNFRYAQHIVERSLRDYKTGYQEPVEYVEKNMIIVRPRPSTLK